MSDQQVRDEVLIIFLAAHDTTANALKWTFYLPSQNTIIEAKLHKELDDRFDFKAVGNVYGRQPASRA